MPRPRLLAAWYTALGAAVAGPLLGGGLILAVDAAPTPFARLDPSYWGLGQGTHEGTVAGLPLDAALAAIARLTSTAVTQKLLLVCAIALAGWGMHRLVDARHPAARVFAGLLYAVNPFVYERIWTGQLYIVLGYALLPWAFAAFRGLIRGQRTSPWVFAAWAVATGIASAHMAILLGLLCVCTLVASALAGRARPRFGRRSLLGVALAVAASVWWLLPTSGVTELWSHVGRAQLAYYASVAMPHYGLPATLAALSGYWNDAQPEISYLPAWPLLALTLLMLAAGGTWVRRRDPVTWAVVAAGVAGFALALGYAWTPTRAPFVWLMAHFTPLRSFRESGKGLALVAFAYAYLGSSAVDDLARSAGRLRRPRRAMLARGATVALLLVVPLALGARELWGEWGQLQSSRYPSSWAQANDYLSRVAQRSRTLVLPFHGYFALSFAHGRVVANPAANYFDAPVVISSSVGGPNDVSDPQQAQIAALLSSRSSNPQFSQCLAALGISRVLVLHQADWASYGNLALRPGMSIERSWPGVTLYRSSSPASLVMARTSTGNGCRDWSPVPAVRAGLTGLRLRAAPPAGAPLRVEMPDSSDWVRAGAGELRYAGWAGYRRDYIIGGLLFVLVFGWPLVRLAIAASDRRRRRPSRANPNRTPADTRSLAHPARPH